jgi:mRNA-degrading endonuclease RelE of RelBE toxin-antitoxin system
MSYKDVYHPRVKADLKKLDKPAVKEIHSIHLDILLDNPFTGECLYGDLEGVFSYHFRGTRLIIELPILLMMRGKLSILS